MDNITFMIKTLLRPQCLRRLLESIRIYYPNVPVMIADDSPEPYPEVADGFGSVEYITYPFDVGPSHCYLDMIARIETPGVVFLDDDFVFIDETRIEDFLPYMEEFDILGGDVWNPNKRQWYRGAATYEVKLRRVYRRKIVVDGDGPFTVGHIDNFWLGHTDKLGSFWDPKIKVGHHGDCFFGARGRLKVGFYPPVKIGHQHEQRPDSRYVELRYTRRAHLWNIFLDKWGLDQWAGMKRR